MSVSSPDADNADITPSSVTLSSIIVISKTSLLKILFFPFTVSLGLPISTLLHASVCCEAQTATESATEGNIERIISLIIAAARCTVLSVFSPSFPFSLIVIIKAPLFPATAGFDS